MQGSVADATDTPKIALWYGPAMPGPLQNVRWERYAQGRALLKMSIEESYAHAGGTGNAKTQSSKLSCRPEIQQRILDLQAESVASVIEEIQTTRERVHAELWENVSESKVGIKVTTKGDTVYLQDASGKTVKDATGEPIQVHVREGQVINKALELLGLDIGMFPKQVKLDHSSADPFKGMSTEAILLEAKAKLKSEIGWDLNVSDLLELIDTAQKVERGIDVPGLPEGTPAAD